jgi:ribosomal protein L19
LELAVVYGFIVVVKKGLVRRAKLNYIKDLNKAIKIKERN